MGFLGLFNKKKKSGLSESEPSLEEQEESLVNGGAGVIKQKKKDKKEKESNNHHVIVEKKKKKQGELKEGDEEEVVPTIYCINGVKGLQKADRKWIKTADLEDQFVTDNFPVIVHIMNFLRKDDGIYYKYIENPDQLAAIKDQIKENKSNVVISSVQDVGVAGDNSQQQQQINNNPDGQHIEAGNSSNDQGGDQKDKVAHYIVSNEKPVEGQILHETKKRIDAERIFLSPGVHAHYIDELDKSIAQLLDEGNPKDEYKNLDFEARGGFGSVFAAKVRNPHSSTDQTMVALKKMAHKTPKQKRMNLTEVGFLKYCKHPNIAKFICAYQKNEELWMITEFMEGGTLKEAISNFTFDEPRIAYIAREMLQGIAYLHSQQLCHRDLKSSNIMISTTGEIKLIDFGLAIDFSHESSDIHMCGSPFWMCPEMILGQPHNLSSDIWSFGVCVVEMLKGKLPHYRSRLKAMITVATSGMVLPRSEYPDWSEEAHSFLEQILQMDPTKRPTAQELLLHPFLGKACTIKEIKEILPALFMSSTLTRQGLF